MTENKPYSAEVRMKITLDVGSVGNKRVTVRPKGTLVISVDGKATEHYAEDWQIRTIDDTAEQEALERQAFEAGRKKNTYRYVASFSPGGSMLEATLPEFFYESYNDYKARKG